MESSTPETPLASQWFNSAQLLLAEKRTSLSLLRTGVGILILPLSVLGLLIATTKSSQSGSVIHLLVPILAISAFLAILAIALIIHALVQLHRYDRMLRQLKESHPVLGDIIW
ncbi:hypothetical protein N9A70_00540 [Akkermansiaceae bacterium]|nr:hypothetical protein [Akkermansiaceae bacterium]MDA7886796.1 hypothetical protein [bacterium]MDA7934361.1 hypothetical protein [Akkermansiaceae bacterium]MDB4466315.1 hypothetical protein [bacterium]MDB4572272.1 hypothetical protein [Akkermansiaceae bacterium]